MHKTLAAVTVTVLMAGCRIEKAPSDSKMAESFQSLAQASLSKIDGTLEIPGLSPTSKCFATNGVCRTFTQATPTTFFAQGYVVAQDRLWHMEMNRRVAQGRTAEIVGPPACRTIGWCGCSGSADRSTTRNGRPIIPTRGASSRRTCAGSTRSSPRPATNCQSNSR